MYNMNSITNLAKKVLFNYSSKSTISTKPDLKRVLSDKSFIRLSNEELAELALESKMKRYGVSRDMLLDMAEFNVEWDLEEDGAAGLPDAIEKAKRVEKEGQYFVRREYLESRL